MIAFLRFIGLMNAALWLGAVVFMSAVAGPAAASPKMEQLLGSKNFPFFSEAFAQIIVARYFIFLAITALIALLHLLAEWLYMGRPTRRFSTTLLGSLLALILMGGLWIQPHLQELHHRRHAPQSSTVEREAATRSFHVWQAGLLFLNISLMAGLVVYTWRIAHPSDAPRFISSVKFRG